MSPAVASAPALPALTGEPPDPGGASFEVLAALGERVAIALGRVRDPAVECPAVEWTTAPHTRFDGVGALADLLRARGADPGPLPTLARPEDPGLLRTLWATLRHDPSGDRQPAAGWRRFDPTARPGLDGPPPAWRVLTADATARLEARARALEVSTNSLLLTALDRAVGGAPERARAGLAGGTQSASADDSSSREAGERSRRTHHTDGPLLVDDPTRAGLWMVPVNMRGAVRAARDTANQSAYLPVVVAPGHDARGVHAEVKRLLAANVHWATWQQATFARVIGRRLYARAIRRYYERPAHPWRGAFSNLGAWDCPGLDDDALVFAPPALKTIPLAAGAVTWRGRLGLALHAHPALSLDPAEWTGWLDAWVAALEAR